MNIVKRVLVCDDDLVREAFETWFTDDLETRRQRTGKAALRRLEVDGQVCRTLVELTDALEEAIESSAPPDLVLIDDWLQSEAHRETVRSALDAVVQVRAAFGEGGPRCVLHTADPKPNDIHAFCELGGHNAVDKRRGLERAEILWATLDGHCWEPPPLRTHVMITDANGRLLPYMELPYWKVNARRDIPQLTDAAANRAKSRLVEAFDLLAGSEPSEIAHAANDHGLTWVPLAARHLLAANHPEHRPEPFRHRSQLSET